jgi:nitrite reductase/ring-hydroxylating ferredoxin subunit
MSDAPWADVLAAADLPEGALTPAELDGDAVLLFRTGGSIFAIAGRCTHAGMPLRTGQVRGTGDDAIVTCPAHGSRFRLADGKVLRPPAPRPLACYDAREVDGRIELRPR